MGTTQNATMAIKIVARLSKPVKHCYGCGCPTHSENYYEGDTETLWCDDCYVTDEKLKEIQSRMPFCQAKKVNPKFRIVAALKPKPKKVKCTVVARLSVAFD
jgi:hypothetical protein